MSILPFQSYESWRERDGRYSINLTFVGRFSFSSLHIFCMNHNSIAIHSTLWICTSASSFFSFSFYSNSNLLDLFYSLTFFRYLTLLLTSFQQKIFVHQKKNQNILLTINLKKSSLMSPYITFSFFSGF